MALEVSDEVRPEVLNGSSERCQFPMPSSPLNPREDMRLEEGRKQAEEIDAWREFVWPGGFGAMGKMVGEMCACIVVERGKVSIVAGCSESSTPRRIEGLLIESIEADFRDPLVCLTSVDVIPRRIPSL